MVTSVAVAEELAARLLQLQAAQHDIAVLSGVWLDTTLFVVGGMYETETKMHHLTAMMEQVLPGGVEVVGIACATPSAMLRLTKELHSIHGGKLVALCTSSDADATTTTSNTISAHMFTNGTLVASGTCTLKSTHAMQQQLGYTWFTTNATVPVQVTTGVPPNPPKGVATAVVSSALSGTGLLGMMQVDGVLQPIAGTCGGTMQQPTPVVLYGSPTASSAGAPSLTAMPIKGEPSQVHAIQCHLSALVGTCPSDKNTCLSDKNTSTPQHTRIAQALHATLQQQARAVDHVLTSRTSMSPSPPSTLTALHFLPPGWVVPVTVVQPVARGGDGQVEGGVDEDGEELRECRKAWHMLFGLPMNRPLLRAANALPPPGTPAPTRLSNVHQGLPPSGVVGGTVHLVSGVYDYYHYMQDRVDDKGWGCAYRSLQTLCSWFQRQGYTSMTPPSHRDIQTTLVQIGDKPVEFVGSKQWIGAIELGYVLDTLLGITSKVITASSGDAMPDKARALAEHFDMQGTPVMIGGGVLAYTLLGVDCNLATGECAFLILDPHYTGSDAIEPIHAGKWVAWKRYGEDAAAGGPLFVKGSFYNMLCPQRPDVL